MWGVVTLKPNGLSQAEKHLGNQDVNTFAPRFHCEDTRKTQLMFPGYLMIDPPEDVEAATLGSTRGVAGVLSVCHKESLILGTIITKLILEALSNGGLVQAPSSSRAARPARARGSRLIVSSHRSNLFSQYATYIKPLPKEPGLPDRCVVSVQLLGRTVKTEMREQDLAAA